MYIFRLHRGDDLKQSILEFCKMNNINSGIMACIIDDRLLSNAEFFQQEKFCSSFILTTHILKFNQIVIFLKKK